MTEVIPITPNEAKGRRKTAVPAQVLEAFNELIVEGLCNGSSTVSQKDAVARIQSKINATLGNEYTYQEICDRGWLNVEDIYRGSGWKVTYDKPGYNETYDATFEFKAK